MDLIEFLRAFVPNDLAGVPAAAAIGAAAIFGLIEYLDRKRVKLPPDVKFWGSLGLAFVLPVTAYVALQVLISAAITLNGVFLAVAVGWMISQGIHRADEMRQESQESQENTGNEQGHDGEPSA